jgi:hypothetical protein
MAPLDTSIYGQIRPYTMADPMEQTAKLYTLQNAAMGMEKNRRALAADDDIRAAAQEAGGDPNKLVQSLMSKGRVSEATALRKTIAEQQAKELDQRLKLAEVGGSVAISMDAAWRDALQKSGGNREVAIAAIQPVWSQTRARLSQIGINAGEQFDPDANFASIGTAKEVASYLKGIRERFGAPVEAVVDGRPVLIQPDSQGGKPRVVEGVTPAPKDELGRLQARRAQLPEGSPERAELDAAIAREIKTGRGTNVTVNTGPMNPGKAGANKIDEGLLDSTSNLMRLDAISSQFKPEYQQYATKGMNWWNSVKEKAGVNLNNKEKRDLEQFSAYKRNAINSLNEYIKSITGAAMTDAEAQRILKGLPNPGTGVFDGDSPTEFKAKMDDAIKRTKMAVARGAYLKRNGMSLEDGKGNAIVPLDSMPQIMNARGLEIEEQLKSANPRIEAGPLGRAVRRQLSQEFGLAAD